MPSKLKVTQRNVLTVPVGTYTIAERLYLRVRSDGVRQFIVRVQHEGKRVDKVVGNPKKISIKEAKVARNEWLANRNIAGFESPAPTNDITFEDFSARVLAQIGELKRWTNEKHGRQWSSTVTNYALPIIGKLPVKDVNREAILKVLKPIWSTKNVTASRLRGRLEKILNYAVEEGLLSFNPAVWKGGLEMYLASPAKFKTHNHHAAMSLEELKAFVPQLRSECGTVFKAILFGTLTATRAMEFCHAKWDEIDFESCVWSIPPERRKDRKPFPHRVPLSHQAITLLKSLDRRNDFLFPARLKDSEPINQYSPGTIVRRKTKQTATMHGMRSVFRDWCSESGVQEVVAEKCLMHATGSAVVLAYQRSDLLDLRREVMQRWADEIMPVESHEATC